MEQSRPILTRQMRISDLLSGFLTAVMALGPLAAALAAALDAGRRSPVRANWLADLLLLDSRRAALYLRSVLYAGSVSLAALILGLVIALWLVSQPKLAVSRWRWAYLALLPVPAYVLALGLFQAFALFEPWVALPTGGLPTAWFAATLIHLPLTTAAALLGLESVDPIWLDAARVSGSQSAGPARRASQVLWQIRLPLALPVAAAGAGFVFVLTLLDFGLPSLFQVRVYALDLFARFSGMEQTASVLAASVPLLLPAGLVLAAVTAGLRRFLGAGGRMAPREAAALSASPDRPGQLALTLAGGLGLALLITPAFFLFATPVGLASFPAALELGGRELLQSAETAALAATLALLPTGISGLLASAGMRRHAFLWLLVLLPLAAPSTLYGLGLAYATAAWPESLLFLIPAAGQAIRFSPFAVILLSVWQRRLPQALIEAARVTPAPRRRRFFCVRLPLLSPALVASWALVFSLALGELPLALLLAPPGREPISVKIFNYLHYGASGKVAALCLLLVAGTLLPILALGLIWPRWRRTRR